MCISLLFLFLPVHVAYLKTILCMKKTCHVYGVTHKKYIYRLIYS